MKQKTLLKLTIVLIIGVILILAKNYWANYARTVPNQYLKTVTTLNQDAIDNIIFTQNQGKLEFSKQDGHWLVASKSADMTKVDQLLTAIFADESPLIVAQNESQHEKLEVNDELGLTVTLKTSAETKLSLRIGRPVNGGRAVVVVGNNQVYNLRDLPFMSLDSNDWLDLTILQIEPAQIKEINFVTNGFTLSQNEQQQWQFVDIEAEIDNNKVVVFAQNFNPFTSIGIAEEQKLAEFNLVNPELTITLLDQSENKTTLEFYQGETEYGVKKIPGDELYLIDSVTITIFDKTNTDFHH